VKGLDNSNDLINGQGGHDTLSGLSGNDILRADSGNDHVYGGAGNDRIDGGSGNDRLHGEAGNDRIDGGSGSDWLAGGTGSDVFVYGPGSSQDLILDFGVEDKLDLSAFGRGGMAGLVQKATITTAPNEVTALDFGNGDRLMVYGIGIGTLSQSNIVF
jgi:Ca2+-binding RTX toxin-like protein